MDKPKEVFSFTQTNSSTEESFRNILRRSLLLPLIFSAALFTQTGWEFHRLSKASEAMLQSERKLSHIASLNTAFLKMQSSVRGYLLTGNPDFLDLFSETLPTLTSAFSILETFPLSNSQELVLSEQMKTRFLVWIGEAKSFIEFRKTHPDGLPPNYLLSKKGGATETLELFNQLHELQTSETIRKTSEYTTQREVFLTWLFGGLLTITIAFLLIHRSQLMKLSDLYKRSESNFFELTDLIPQMLWVANADGKFEWLNSNWFRYTGKEPKRLLGSSWNCGNQEFKLGTSPIEVQFKIPRFDGVNRWFLVRAIPIKDQNQKVVCWFGTNTDIEEERQLRFEHISVASHELKSPLTALSLRVQMLLRNPRSPEEIISSLAFCNSQVTRMTTLLDQILDLTQIQRKEIQLNRNSCDLVPIVRQILEDHAEEAHHKQSPIILTANESIIVNMDSTRIGQVISNLVTNALKYGPGKPIQVSVEQNSPTEARVIVKDEGIGIPPEKQKIIFERFERGSHQSVVTGLGLGLYISRQIVIAHGGQISVESASGRGSTFTVLLPL